MSEKPGWKFTKTSSIHPQILVKDRFFDYTGWFSIGGEKPALRHLGDIAENHVIAEECRSRDELQAGGFFRRFDQVEKDQLHGAARLQVWPGNICPQ